jgi:hypothetical protein
MRVIVNTIIPAGTGAGTVYIPVDADYTVIGFYCTPSTATGCTSTVTATSGSTAVGTAAIGAADAAAAITAATMNATLATRKTKITSTVPLKIAVDARTNSSTIYVTVALDPFALQKD